MPLLPVNKKSLPAITTLFLPTPASVTASSRVSVTLILLPMVNTPLVASLASTRQALTTGFGACTSIDNGEFLPLKICISDNLAPTLRNELSKNNLVSAFKVLAEVCIKVPVASGPSAALIW